MSVLTLAPMGETQIVDRFGSEYKRFMHYYNFPQYSVNRPLWCSGRRRSGHGALEERALEQVLLTRKGVSLRYPSGSRNAWESNGSSSQALSVEHLGSDGQVVCRLRLRLLVLLWA